MSLVGGYWRRLSHIWFAYCSALQRDSIEGQKVTIISWPSSVGRDLQINFAMEKMILLNKFTVIVLMAHG